MGKKLISESLVREAIKSGKALQLGPDDIVTPAAKDLIRSSNIPIRTNNETNAVNRQTLLSLHEHRRHETAILTSKKLVVFGSDHGGFQMKEMLKDFVTSLGFDILDYGCDSPERTDYPIFAAAVAKAVAKGDAWRGIIVDGAGIGSAITANKFSGVRAAMAYDTLTANNCREHNDANVLSLGGLLLGITTVKEIVRIFLRTDFDTRHQNRIDMIESIEKENFEKE